jgi:hypothetical protein
MLARFAYVSFVAEAPGVEMSCVAVVAFVITRLLGERGAAPGVSAKDGFGVGSWFVMPGCGLAT